MPVDFINLLRRVRPLERLAILISAILRNVPRVYSAALILLIGALTYLAVRYLITSLAVTAAPPQITALPARLTPDILQTDWAAWQALSATENARSPLAHYHRVDHWMEPDHFNDCTRSGCHAALPHSNRKEVRAFLNMHATSMHCGVCHMNVDDRPLQLVWYDLNTGKTSKPPALLAAFDRLTTDSKRRELLEASPAQQAEFVALLRKSARDAQHSPALEQLADHFAALRPRTDPFEKLVAQARTALPNHFRGEYGKKLALRDPGHRRDLPRLGHPNTKQAVQDWLERNKSATADEKKHLLAAVHPLKRDKALHCTDCHTVDGSLIDFAKVGYPPARRDMLTGQIIFRMIEHINTGQPLHMPEIAAPPSPRGRGPG